MEFLKRLFGRKLRPIDNVTPRAQRVFKQARRHADRHLHSSVGREHLLLGLLDVEDAVGLAALKKLGGDPERIRKAIEEKMVFGQQLHIEPQIRARDDLMSTIRMAAAEAEALGHSYLGTEHIFLALLSARGDSTAEALELVSVDLSRARQIVLRIADGSPSK